MKIFYKIFIFICGTYTFIEFSTKNCLESAGLHVKDLLEKFQDGKIILKYYTVNNFLNESMRNKLSNVLIKAELHNQKDNKINKTNY